MRLFDNEREDRTRPVTLSELNERVQFAIHASFPDTCWIRAETSDVRENASSGHCYLEFVEKDDLTGQIVAKARGTVWARTFHSLKPHFESIAGRPFASGLKVMACVSVEFHKLYGYSLTVIDIDPSYTLGDLVRKKQEIILRLKEEGIFELNGELPFPALPQRIAIITSPTAAGYEDFVNQLLHNRAGYPFLLKLFPAVMQGEKTEESVIAALDRVAQYADLFDVVVLIRGGGSAADLSCFDSYSLAAHCAQFPLPLVTGIGHERDDSIVDMVAHTRMKTPTAVAAFLIGKMDEQAGELNALQQSICTCATEILTAHGTHLKLLVARLPASVTRLVEQHGTQLATVGSRLSGVYLPIQKRQSLLTGIRRQLQNLTESLLKDKKSELELAGQFLKLASPDYILAQGYALTLKDGKIVKRAAGLAAGDTVTIRHIDGDRTAAIR
ncbi:MAG: exodeoxyribonuclease VII large subunit [Tannerella sp.]|jgi:exodeoxyribonuclease VII large subunit|nr:exodeoxyribonuclease VII large subunit [Tannerella sp.]